MAETDVQSDLNDAGDKTQRAARAGADTARKGADAAMDTARTGIEAEQRSFAGDAGRQGAEAMARAAQTSLRSGQDMARRASDQAADFWRSSLTPMAQMQTELGRWFEQMWRQASPSRLQGGSPFAMLSPFVGHPPADMRETDKGLELNIELPGLKPEDVQLSIRGDSLVLSGEKAEASDSGEGAFRFSERRFGRFERTFALPPGADRSKIDAAFQDGLLRIAIPMSPEAEEARRIPVKG